MSPKSSSSARRRDANRHRATQQEGRDWAEAQLWARWQDPLLQPGRRPAGPDAPLESVRAAAHDRLVRAVGASMSGDETALLESSEALAAVNTQDGNRVGLSVVESELTAVAGERFVAGWQPLDLVHVVAKLHSDAHRSLLLLGLAAERRVTNKVHVDQRWARQLADLDVGDVDRDTHRESDRAHGQQQPIFVSARSGDLTDEFRLIADVRLAVELIAGLRRLPPLPVLIPPPSDRPLAASPIRSAESKLDERVLATVRGLLAKAESTDFAEEADAFTAKAQELMARHAIDLALLDAGAPHVSGVEARRVHIEDPYFEAKAVLLTVVAEANRSSAVMATSLGMVTLFGFPADLDITELLFTSLLTQATSSMVAAGRSVDYAGTSRTKSFRRTFIISFAMRVGERLREAGQAAADDAMSTVGSALLPVLASRNEQVQAHQQSVFPRVETKRSSVSNAAGWHAGRSAADRASLNANPHGIPRR